MKHGFVKVGTAVPHVTVGDCEANLREMLSLAEEAEKKGVRLLVFPELSLTGSTCADLFFSDVLLQSAERSLENWLLQTKKFSTISIIGFPLVVNDKIYNCAAICQKGQLLGVVPKSNLPIRNELSDARYFSSYSGSVISISLCGQTVPFGTNQLFACQTMSSFRFGVEIGEDLGASVPPSCALTEAGALMIANLSASAESVGREAYRRLMTQSQSARTVCGYIYASCGEGESTTDAVYGGHCMIVENGTLLAERPPFAEDNLLISELDLFYLAEERRQNPTGASSTFSNASVSTFSAEVCETELTRPVERFPFIPSCPEERAARCEQILTVQSKGLAKRMTASYAKTCVIGISGGLDSCLALLVAVNAMDLLGRPHTDVIGVTMPGFGTTSRTKSNAEQLCEELGCQLRCIPIGESVRLHFTDIGHEEANRNVVYENAQARERTQVLMDLANMENGLVVGTGDLSELALGWATYNGDHMSMYGVNADIPKTLIRHIVRFYAERADRTGHRALAGVLRDIVETPVSPELLPADSDGNIAQKTEDLVGPYELHDFYLYHMLRRQESPDKMYRLAKIAFGDLYDDETLIKWLKNFIRRFFAQQFKRSCLPDGPKVGSVGLSPRGTWKMPSDASAHAWMNIAESL